MELLVLPVRPARLVLMVLLAVPRIAYRLMQESRTPQDGKETQPVLLVGAGEGSDLFIRALGADRRTPYRVIGLLSLGKAQTGRRIGGLPILGGVTDAAIDPTNGRRILVVCNQQPFQDTSLSSGVWQTLDGGKTWTQENTGLGMLRVQTVAFRPDGKQIVIGCNGGGFYVSGR